jgi:hypothetical protein
MDDRPVTAGLGRRTMDVFDSQRFASNSKFKIQNSTLTASEGLIL